MVLDVDPERRRRLDRGAHAQGGAEAFEPGAADLVDGGVAGAHVGEAGIERRLEREVVAVLRPSRGRGQTQHEGGRRRAARAQRQQPAQRQAGDEVEQRQRHGRREQPGLEVGLAGLAVRPELDAVGQRLDRPQLAEPGGQVQRPARPAGAVKTGRVRRPHPRLGEVGGGERAAGRRRLDQAAEPVERLERRQRAVPRLARDA